MTQIDLPETTRRVSVSYRGLVKDQTCRFVWVWVSVRGPGMDPPKIPRSDCTATQLLHKCLSIAAPFMKANKHLPLYFKNIKQWNIVTKYCRRMLNFSVSEGSGSYMTPEVIAQIFPVV